MSLANDNLSALLEVRGELQLDTPHVTLRNLRNCARHGTFEVLNDELGRANGADISPGAGSDNDEIVRHGISSAGVRRHAGDGRCRDPMALAIHRFGGECHADPAVHGATGLAKSSRLGCCHPPSKTKKSTPE